MKNWHYYEAHVTLPPETGDRFEVFKIICVNNGFKPANLLMSKSGKLEPSNLDMFCTAKDETLLGIQVKLNAILKDLHASGFVVKRSKLEYTLSDSKYEKDKKNA